MAHDAVVTDTGAQDVAPIDTGVLDTGPDDTGAPDVTTLDASDAQATETGVSDATSDVAYDVVTVDGGACGPLVDLTTAGTVTGTTTRYLGTTSGTPMTAAVAASCGAADHELIFAYTTHAAATLAISVANPGTPLTFDTVLTARSSCLPGAGELACNDDHLPDRRSSLTTIASAAGQTVYIVLGGSTTAGSRYVDQGPFELTVTENTLTGGCDPSAMPSGCAAGFQCVGTGASAACRGYTESTVASPTWIDACATGTHLTLSGRDDGHTPSITLPFPFTYYGTAYTSAAADTNGYLVLGSTTPSDMYSAMLPIGDGPLLAPFHNDLVINPAPGGDICTLTVGTGATQQFAIEWTGATIYNHTAVALQFEAVLNAAGNTIDFVYHTLSGAGADAAYANGSNSAIGLEGTDGTTVLRHVGAVTTASALHFTPAP